MQWLIRVDVGEFPGVGSWRLPDMWGGPQEGWEGLNCWMVGRSIIPGLEQAHQSKQMVSTLTSLVCLSLSLLQRKKGTAALTGSWDVFHMFTAVLVNQDEYQDGHVGLHFRRATGLEIEIWEIFFLCTSSQSPLYE